MGLAKIFWFLLLFFIIKRLLRPRVVINRNVFHGTNNHSNENYYSYDQGKSQPQKSNNKAIEAEYKIISKD